MKKQTPETMLKGQCRDYLDKVAHIFHYHNLQGVASYKGLPDMNIHHRGMVIYLEFKSPNGKLSPAQLDFQAQCELDKIPYHVIKSIEDLMGVIND